MKIKRLLAAISSICIAVSLCGCGKNIEKNSRSLPAPTNTEAKRDNGYKPGEGIVSNEYGSLADLDSETLSGGKLTASDLGSSDLTAVYIWKTDNASSKSELPMVEKLSAQLPEGVGLIGLCLDAGENLDAAKKLAEDSKLTFETICNASGLAGVTTAPAMIYVDKKGNVIGEPKVGKSLAADEAAFIQEYTTDINAHLGMARAKYAADGGNAPAETTSAVSAPVAETPLE